MSYEQQLNQIIQELNVESTRITRVVKKRSGNKTKTQLPVISLPQNVKIFGNMLFSLHTASAETHDMCSSTCNADCSLCQETENYMKIITRIHRKNNRMNKCGKKMRREKCFIMPDKYKQTHFYKADREFRTTTQKLNRILNRMNKN